MSTLYTQASRSRVAGNRFEPADCSPLRNKVLLCNALNIFGGHAPDLVGQGLRPLPAIDDFTKSEPIRLISHAFRGVDELRFQLTNRPLHLLGWDRFILQSGYFAVDEALKFRKVGSGQARDSDLKQIRVDRQAHVASRGARETRRNQCSVEA